MERMQPLNGQTLAFIDFNLGHVSLISRDDGEDKDLLPTILDALSSDHADRPTKVPGHEECTLRGGTTSGSLSLGVFRDGRPLAVVFIGGADDIANWQEMDGLCHRTFGSPLGQLRMPGGPWAVLVRFSSQSEPVCEWLGEFAQEVERSWVARRERLRS